MPQAPRTEAETAVFRSLLYNINDLQLACSTDIVCGTLAGIQDYATRVRC